MGCGASIEDVSSSSSSHNNKNNDRSSSSRNNRYLNEQHQHQKRSNNSDNDDAFTKLIRQKNSTSNINNNNNRTFETTIVAAEGLLPWRRSIRDLNVNNNVSIITVNQNNQPHQNNAVNNVDVKKLRHDDDDDNTKLSSSFELQALVPNLFRNNEKTFINTTTYHHHQSKASKGIKSNEEKGHHEVTADDDHLVLENWCASRLSELDHHHEQAASSSSPPPVVEKELLPLISVYFCSETGSVIKLSSRNSNNNHAPPTLRGPPSYHWKPLDKRRIILSKRKSNRRRRLLSSLTPKVREENENEDESLVLLSTLPLQVRTSISNFIATRRNGTSDESFEIDDFRVKLISLVPVSDWFQSGKSAWFETIDSIFSNPENLIVKNHDNNDNDHNNEDDDDSSSSSSCNNINHHHFDPEREILNMLSSASSRNNKNNSSSNPHHLIHARDFFGRTCLHVLIEDHFLYQSSSSTSKRLDVICQLIKLLILHGAEIHARDNLGRSIFHLIAIKSHLESAVRILRTVFSSSMISNNIINGSSPSHYHSFIVKSKDNRGKTILDHLVQKWKDLVSRSEQQTLSNTDDEAAATFINSMKFIDFAEIRIAKISIREVCGEIMMKLSNGADDDDTPDLQFIRQEVLLRENNNTRSSTLIKRSKNCNQQDDHPSLMIQWSIVHDMIFHNRNDELQKFLCDFINHHQNNNNDQTQDDDDTKNNNIVKNNNPSSSSSLSIINALSPSETSFILDLLCPTPNKHMMDEKSTEESDSLCSSTIIIQQIFDLFLLATRRASTDCFEILLQYYTQIRPVFKKLRKLFTCLGSSSSLEPRRDSNKNILMFALRSRKTANKMIPFLLTSSSSTILSSSSNNNNTIIPSQLKIPELLFGSSSTISVIKNLLLLPDSTGVCPLDLMMSKSLKLHEQNVIQQLLIKVCGGLVGISNNNTNNIKCGGDDEVVGSYKSLLQESFEESNCGKNIIQRNLHQQYRSRCSTSSSCSRSCCCSAPLSSLSLPQRLVNYSIIQQRTSLQNVFLSSELVNYNKAFSAVVSSKNNTEYHLLGNVIKNSNLCSPLLCHSHIQQSVIKVADTANIESVFTSWCNNNHNIHFMFDASTFGSSSDSSSSSVSQLNKESRKKLRDLTYLEIIKVRTEVFGADSAAQFASKSLTTQSLCKALKAVLLDGFTNNDDDSNNNKDANNSCRSSSSSSPSLSPFAPCHLPLWLSWWLYYPIESYFCDFESTSRIFMSPRRNTKSFITNDIYAKHFKSQKTAFPLSGAGKVTHHFLRFAFSSQSVDLSSKEKISICFAICWCYFVKHFECFGVNLASRFRSSSGDVGLLDFAMSTLSTEMKQYHQQDYERRNSKRMMKKKQNNNQSNNSNHNNEPHRHHAPYDNDEDANFVGVEEDEHVCYEQDDCDDYTDAEDDNQQQQLPFLLLPFLQTSLGTRWHLPHSQQSICPTTEKRLSQFLDIFISPRTNRLAASKVFSILLPHLTRLFPRVVARLIVNNAVSSSLLKNSIVTNTNNKLLSAIDDRNYAGFMERMESRFSNEGKDEVVVEGSSSTSANIFDFKILLKAIIDGSWSPHSGARLHLCDEFVLDDERFSFISDDTNNKITKTEDIEEFRNLLLEHELKICRFLISKSHLIIMDNNRTNNSNGNARTHLVPPAFVENLMKMILWIFNDEATPLTVLPLVLVKTLLKFYNSSGNYVEASSSDTASSTVKKFKTKFSSSIPSVSEKHHHQLPLLLPRTFDLTHTINDNLMSEKDAHPDEFNQIEKHFIRQHSKQAGYFIATKYALVDERFSRKADELFGECDAVENDDDRVTIAKLRSLHQKTLAKTFMRPNHLRRFMLMMNCSRLYSDDDEIQLLVARMIIFYAAHSKNNYLSVMAIENSVLLINNIMIQNNNTNNNNGEKFLIMMKQILETILFRREASVEWWKAILQQKTINDYYISGVLINELMKTAKILNVDSKIIDEIDEVKTKRNNDMPPSSSSFIKPRPPSSNQNDEKETGNKKKSVRRALSVVKMNEKVL